MSLETPTAAGIAAGWRTGPDWCRADELVRGVHGADAVELAEIRCPDGTEWSIRYTDYAPTLGQLLSTTTGAPLLEVERTDDGNQWTATLLDRHGDPKDSPVVRYAAAAAVWSRWL